MIANSTFALIQMSVLIAVLGNREEVAQYDRAALVGYAWLAQAFFAPTQVWGMPEMADRIRSGDIAVDLVRPLDVQLSALATDMGRSGYELLFRCVPLVVLGALFFGVAPASAATLALGFVALALATAVSFAFRFLIESGTFYVLHERGSLTLSMLTVSLFSGLVVPVPLFPDWLEQLVELTPFPSMLQTPIDVFLGSTGGKSPLWVIGQQVVWLLVLLASGRVAFELGYRRAVVQGG